MEELTASVKASNAKLDALIEQMARMNTRIERLEEKTTGTYGTTVDANGSPDGTAGQSDSKTLSRVEAQLQHLTHATQAALDVGAKVQLLDARLDALPAVYMRAFEARIDRILTAHSSSSSSSITASYPINVNHNVDSPSHKPFSVPALPTIPDMGISKRLSRLGEYLGRTGSPTSTSAVSITTTTPSLKDDTDSLSTTTASVRRSTPIAEKPAHLQHRQLASFDVIALFPFKPEFDDELEMQAGDIITVDAVCGRNGDFNDTQGWWHGFASDGVTNGWIPSNYVLSYGS
ncbi:hypothetical protein HK100_006714 [Physocladia obscura]|uniref:SH3 domain-containing protein n=1 Tax=Physocladia obscura TaxID=109957 RepID=A0AAD5SRY3_9FUNG|nr:hypothetical protein HK100_006714 [Physocladia obscura]